MNRWKQTMNLQFKFLSLIIIDEFKLHGKEMIHRVLIKWQLAMHTHCIYTLMRKYAALLYIIGTGLNVHLTWPLNSYFSSLFMQNVIGNLYNCMHIEVVGQHVNCSLITHIPVNMTFELIFYQLFQYTKCFHTGTHQVVKYTPTTKVINILPIKGSFYQKTYPFMDKYWLLL